MKVLVTGADGFVGRHLCDALSARGHIEVAGYDVKSPEDALDEGLGDAEVIYHLAGVNRPEHPDDYMTVNRGLTEEICERLVKSGCGSVEGAPTEATNALAAETWADSGAAA